MSNRTSPLAVAFAAIIINLCIGVIYTWSVFSKELTTVMGWSLTEATLPYTFAIAAFAFSSTPGGKMQIKYGGRKTAMISGIFTGCGMLITGTFLNPIGTIIGFGLITGIGIGLGYSSTTPTVVKWYPPKMRGLIIGIVVSGFGGASLYAASLARFLMSSFGVRAAFLILGFLYLSVILTASQFLKSPPGQDDSLADAENRTISGYPKEYNYIDWVEILKTPQFYGLWIMAFGMGISGLLVIGHASTILSLNGAEWGVILVSLMSIGNVCGRALSGACIDHMGRRITTLVFYGFPAAALASLLMIKTPVVIAVMLVIVAVGYGATATIHPFFCAEFYGSKAMSLSFGMMFTGWGVGGVFGPIFAGIMFDRTGSFYTAFTVGALTAAMAALTGFLMNLPKRQREYQNISSHTSVHQETVFSHD